MAKNRAVIIFRDLKGGGPGPVTHSSGVSHHHTDSVKGKSYDLFTLVYSLV